MKYQLMRFGVWNATMVGQPYLMFESDSRVEAIDFYKKHEEGQILELFDDETGSEIKI